MTYRKILKLEDMQSMTIDQIVNLYREDYNVDVSNVESIQDTSNIESTQDISNIKSTQDISNIKSMQDVTGLSITAVLCIGIISSLVGSYVFYNGYMKKQKSGLQTYRDI